MAALDPRLLPLFDVIMQSALAPLGARALSRLDAADGDRFRFDDERDPLAPLTDESDVDRASRQLIVLDTVIGGQLRLEIEVFKRNQALAREIGMRLDLPGALTFETVLIISDGDTEFREGTVRENLLSEGRQVQLERTLQAWERAVGSFGITVLNPPER